MKNINLFIISALITCIAASCSKEHILAPYYPGQTIDFSDTKTSDDMEPTYYNLQSTVKDVISDPAFGDFGHLLFPVDRHIDENLTLTAQHLRHLYMV